MRPLMPALLLAFALLGTTSPLQAQSVRTAAESVDLDVLKSAAHAAVQAKDYAKAIELF